MCACSDFRQLPKIAWNSWKRVLPQKEDVALQKKVWWVPDHLIFASLLNAIDDCNILRLYCNTARMSLGRVDFKPKSIEAKTHAEKKTTCFSVVIVYSHLISTWGDAYAGLDHKVELTFHAHAEDELVRKMPVHQEPWWMTMFFLGQMIHMFSPFCWGSTFIPVFFHLCRRFRDMFLHRFFPDDLMIPEQEDEDLDLQPTLFQQWMGDLRGDESAMARRWFWGGRVVPTRSGGLFQVISNFPMEHEPFGESKDAFFFPICLGTTWANPTIWLSLVCLSVCMKFFLVVDALMHSRYLTYADWIIDKRLFLCNQMVKSMAFEILTTCIPIHGWGLR